MMKKHVGFFAATMTALGFSLHSQHEPSSKKRSGRLPGDKAAIAAADDKRARKAAVRQHTERKRTEK